MVPLEIVSIITLNRLSASGVTSPLIVMGITTLLVLIGTLILPLALI